MFQIDLPSCRPLGVVKTYDDLQRVVRDRVDEMQISCETLDHIAGWADGLAGKILGLRQVKTLGPRTLPLALDALGLALVVVEDPAVTARMRPRYTRRRPTFSWKRERPTELAVLPSALLEHEHEQ